MRFMFGQEVRVQPLGLGRYHGNRCSGKAGVVVDTIEPETAMMDSHLEWVFVRFDLKDGSVLFFDWMNIEDLRPR